MVPVAKNGHLQYTVDGKLTTFDFYIEQAVRPMTLTGSSVQTRLHREFFPRGYSPGNTTITARATSQDGLQEFAKFVRNHQVTMVNTPGSMSFTVPDNSSVGFQRLMQLSVDGEGIVYRGWIPSFTLTKKGVMEPAPQFTFDFFLVFDQHSTNIITSRQIEKLWWAQAGSPTLPNKSAIPAPSITNTPDLARIIDDPSVGLRP